MTLWVVEAGEVFPAEGCALAGAFGAAHSPPRCFSIAGTAILVGNKARLIFFGAALKKSSLPVKPKEGGGRRGRTRGENARIFRPEGILEMGAVW
jgi:hypothetical protein